MVLNFLGEFNKSVGYVGWQNSERYEHIGSMDGFNDSVYRQISSEIIGVLGLKKSYTIFEVAYYFKFKYLAYRVPYQYFWYYKDTMYDDLNIYERQPSIEIPNASFDPKEKNLTLVIDTVFNSSLRKRYSDIVKSDERNEKRLREEKHYACRHENPIFILGTKDGKRLNSIYLLSGDFEIEDLNYEFYFFYNHS